MIPDARTHELSPAPPAPGADYVLYWMDRARRLRSNFALDRAIGHAREFQKPLLIVEILAQQPGTSTARSHAFIAAGMQVNVQAASSVAATYLPYVEPRPGDAKRLLEQLATRACVVVADLFPSPDAGARRADLASLPVRTEAVDSCGLLPLSATENPAPSAYVFRRWTQKLLSEGWDRPATNPLAGLRLPQLESPPELRGHPLDSDWSTVPGLDHVVGVAPLRGGGEAGVARLQAFVANLPSYGADRNHPDSNATSGLSPYLHHGHISASEVVDAVLEGQNWRLDEVGVADGKRNGWWGLDESREAFLDQVVVWRELGHHFAHRVADHNRFETLPAWAQKTLREHTVDERPTVYSLEELESAETHDEVWNAAQRELRSTGIMHNYMRMLWGKKILEWTRTPEEAFERAVYLNDRWALDGLDPNSYSGIGWVFGRFDRPWGPIRPIYGSIRYMTSASAERKLRLKSYLARYGAEVAEQASLFG